MSSKKKLQLIGDKDKTIKPTNMNLNYNLINLEGKEYTNGHAGKYLAEILSNQTQGNVLKLMDYARALYKEEPITPDAADIKMLEGIINNSGSIPVIIKEQLINSLK